MPTRYLFILIALSVLLMLGSAPLTAGSLPKSQVSSGAKWIIHLDMDQFSPSKTCRILNTSGHADAKNFQSLLNHYRTLLGVDPLKDLTGITVYGNEMTGSRGIALISGALNNRSITRQFSTYPQYRTKNSGKLTLHSWQDKSTGRPLWAAFHTSRQLILASDEPSLMKADAALGGDSPTLSNGKPPVLPIPPTRKGSFFTAVTRGYAGASPSPVMAQVLKNTELATIQISEQAGIVDGLLILEAISADAAVFIHQTLKGVMFFSTLSEESSPFANLANMGTITQDGKNVTLKIHCPASDAAELLAATLLAQ
ncbi:MAG: hypothetical protein WCO77_01160 [bacterium]